MVQLVVLRGSPAQGWPMSGCSTHRLGHRTPLFSAGISDEFFFSGNLCCLFSLNSNSMAIGTL